MYTGSIKTDADKLDKPNQKCKMNASFSKLNESSKKKLKITKDKDLQGNRVIDIRLLVEFIQKLVCPDCQVGNILISEMMFGLASKFTAECDNDECDYKDKI